MHRQHNTTSSIQRTASCQPNQKHPKQPQWVSSPLQGSDGSSPARPTGPSLAGLYRILSCLEPLSGGTTCTCWSGQAMHRVGFGPGADECEAGLAWWVRDHTPVAASKHQLPPATHRVVEGFKGTDGILEPLKLDKRVAQRADARGEHSRVGQHAKPAGTAAEFRPCQ